MLDLFQMSEIL